MRAILASIVLALTATTADAHEFWLDLGQYRHVQGDAVPLRFLVGAAADIAPWRLAWDRVVSLRSYGPDGVSDQQAGITPKSANNDGGASVVLGAVGTHILALESHHAASTLPAKEFNAYLVEEGLTPAIELRQRTGTSTAEGREIYSRRATALVQVGDRPTDNVTTPIGLSLEIVPEHNPYALVAGGKLPVRIYYLGKPLPGAQVLLGNLDAPSSPPVAKLSDPDGRTVFEMPRKGRWRLSVVWTRPLEKHPSADFETIFSSLTFGS